MKKRIGILLASLVLVLSACILSSCFGNNTNTDQDHVHAFYTCIDQTEVTCTQDATKTYQCECGEINVVITEEALGHHEIAEVIEEKEPTCTQDGTIEYICGNCNQTINEKRYDAKGHTEVAYEEVLATCISGGFTGGAYCSVCEEIISERTELEPTGIHTSLNYEDVAPTCGTVGYTGGTYCSVCEAELTERTELPAQGEHTPASYEDVAPTCGTVGYTGGTYCSVCEIELTKRTELPVQGEHTEVDVKATAATCTATGLSAGKQCTVCLIFTVPQKEVPMLPHNYRYSVVTAPQYQTAGLGQYVCSDCEASYDEEIPALTYQPSDIWTGDTASGFDSGDGTKENPYIIKTAAQLAYFANQVNSGEGYKDKYIALGNDIVLNDTTNYKVWSKTNAPANGWSPIGSSGGGFYGNFDGCSYTIYGLYCYQKKMSSGTNYTAGLFGNVSNGVIQNLTVADSYVHSDHGQAGGIVSYADASDSNVTIKNCHFSGTVISSGHAGGIVGVARCGWVGHDYVGGSISAVLHDGTLKISDCTAKGIVASNDMIVPQYDVYVGGIAGNLYYACGSVSISGCTNYASVTSKSHGGGIAGVLAPSDNNRDSVTFSITSCVNEGDITSNGNVGGIASRFQFLGEDTYRDSVTIANCSNTGKIVSYANDKDACAGGIFGDLRSSGTQSASIYNLYNLGEIVVTGTAYNVGGIAGGLSLESDYSVITFKNSFNGGNIPVTGASNVGGLFGYSYASNRNPYTLESCYNEGNVTSGGQNVGGLFGYGSNLTIKDSYNLGTVTGGEKKVGGLLGYAYGVKVTTSFNAGTVSGTGVYVGAIAGQDDNSNLVAFFKEGCATDGKGKVQGATGSNRNTEGSTFNSLSETDMYNQSSYRGFDFSKVWNEPSSSDKTYPTLKKVVKVPTEDAE